MVVWRKRVEADCSFFSYMICYKDQRIQISYEGGEKMKRFKKMGVTAVLMAMLVFAMGCGGNKDNQTAQQEASAAEAQMQEMTPQERYEAMNAFQKDITSMDARIGMDMDITLGEERVQSVIDMRMVSFTEPFKAKMEMNMDLGEYGAQEMQAYVEFTEDNRAMVYLYDGTSWTTQEALSVEAIMEQYDARNSVGSYVEGITDLTEVGREQIGGRETVKLTGVLKGEALKQAMLESGSLDSLSSLFDEEQMSGILGNLENENSLIELWVDAQTNELVKYTQDMTGVTNKIYENMSAMLSEGTDFEMSVGKMVVTIDNISYNNAEDFEIPEEARQ